MTTDGFWEPGSRVSWADEPRGPQETALNPRAEEGCLGGTGSSLVLTSNFESSVTSFTHPYRRQAGARSDGAGEARWEATAMSQRTI